MHSKNNEKVRVEKLILIKILLRNIKEANQWVSFFFYIKSDYRALKINVLKQEFEFVEDSHHYLSKPQTYK